MGSEMCIRDRANVVNNTNTTFIDAPFTADIEPIIVSPTVQVSITTLANDDPTFIGEVIKHSLSENSKTRIAVDDLANVVNNVTKAIKLRSISMPVIKMVADDNLAFTASIDDVPSIDSVTTSTLTDDDPSAVISTAKNALSSTPRGKCAEGDSSIIVAAVTPSLNKVDTATLADDDPSTMTYAVGAYTPTLKWYSSNIG